MFDYRGIEALFTVQELQSFEAAARKLHITQSAVSQRIKGLESQYGQPVLIRSLPYIPTPLGASLIAHFKKLCLLEKVLEQQIKQEAIPLQISIALNRDSLETWFLDFLANPLLNDTTIEIIADDQELTLDYLKKGLVSACVSPIEKPLIGGHAVFLGKMEYCLVASSRFYRSHFSEGKFEENVKKAPAIKFDKNDFLHERYLEKNFGLSGIDGRFHRVPSVAAFKKICIEGYGYGLIPRIDMLEELSTDQLIQISPKTWNIPLFWHYWDIDSKFYTEFNHAVIKLAKLKLNQNSIKL